MSINFNRHKMETTRAVRPKWTVFPEKFWAPSGPFTDWELELGTRMEGPTTQGRQFVAGSQRLLQPGSRRRHLLAAAARVRTPQLPHPRRLHRQPQHVIPATQPWLGPRQDRRPRD